MCFSQGWGGTEMGAEGEGRRKKTGIFSAGFLPLLERKNKSTFQMKNDCRISITF